MPKAADAAVKMWAGRPAPGVGAYELIGLVLRESPRFPSAACRNIRPALFDAATQADAVKALRICSACPVAGQCYTWANRQDEMLLKRNGRGGGLEGVAGNPVWGKARKWLGTA